MESDEQSFVPSLSADEETVDELLSVSDSGILPPSYVNVADPQSRRTCSQSIRMDDWLEEDMLARKRMKLDLRKRTQFGIGGYKAKQAKLFWSSQLSILKRQIGGPNPKPIWFGGLSFQHEIVYMVSNKAWLWITLW